MRRLVLHREPLSDLTPAELAAIPAAAAITRDIICIASGMRTCEGQELTDTCPASIRPCFG